VRERAFDTEVRDAFAAFAPELAVATDETPIWTPLPGPQTLAYYSEADILFFGGAGGGGKSDLLLGLATTAQHSSVIFRTEFAQFRGPDGIIERSKELLGMRGRLNESTYQWRGLPGGRSFEFAGVGLEKHLLKWKGRPHDGKFFDELPDFPEARFRFLIGWLRTAILGQRVRVVGTGNPPTTSAGEWVIRFWAPWLDKQHPNPAKPGELRWFATIDGKDLELPTREPVRDSKGELVRPMSRTFIPARVEDNPYYMRTGYVDVLNNLPEPLRSQLRFGDFEATQDDNPWQVIPTAWVKAAQRRWLTQPKPDVPLTAVGNDPSRGGQDKFCIAKRYGAWVAPVIKHPGKAAPDGKRGAELLVQALKGEAMPLTIGIDVIGSAGSSVFDQARDLSLPVISLNGSEKSVAFDQSGRLSFFNKRAEWHWHVRELLDPNSGQDVALPDDPELLADLCAPKWRPTPRGIRILEKADIKELIGRSPDVGEAVIYAFADDSGSGAGFLAYAKQHVDAAKAKEHHQNEAQPTEENPWLQALPTSKE
jgi:hypothetical protein